MAALSSAVLYILGFVGLAAVSLIPLRSWQSCVKSLARRAAPSSRLVLPFVVLLSLSALLAEFWLLMRLVPCLSGGYCGPTVAHGWIYLAMLGAVYLVFESLLAAVLAVAKPAIGGAT